MMKQIPAKLTLWLILLLPVQFNIHAQSSDSISIKGIPHKLFWENVLRAYKLYSDSIVIECGEKTDMFRDPNVTYYTDNAPKLLFRPDDNFILTPSIQHSLASKWDEGVIVIKLDSMNRIKFCFERDYTGTHRVISVVTKDISDDFNSISIRGNTVFYKVAKADKVITLYCSTD